MIPILRDAGLSRLMRPRRDARRRLSSPRGRSGCPTTRPVPGHQGRADLPAHPGSGRPRSSASRPGAANGQTFDPDGRVYLLRAERPPGLADEPRRLRRRDGRRDVRGQAAEQPQRHRRPLRRHPLLHRPALRGRRRPTARSCPSRAVFALRRPGQTSPVVHEGFEKPNGLAFTGRRKTLYVCDTAKYHVRAFELGPPATSSPAATGSSPRWTPTRRAVPTA